MITADRDHMLVLSGTGDVIHPSDGITPSSAISAVLRLGRRPCPDRALDRAVDARCRPRHRVGIAADLCIYTNRNIEVEVLE